MEKRKTTKEAQISSRKPLRVYVVGRSIGYANWVSDTLVDRVEEADLVLLTGGEDVNPAYYGEQPHPTTSFTNRDVNEFEIIQKAIELKIPLYGTCRGAQILTVAAGGKLIQNQSNRYSPHLTSDFWNELKEGIFELSDYQKSQMNHLGSNRLFRDSLFKNVQQIILGSNIPTIVTSAHHQAPFPYNLPKEDYHIVTWTTGMHIFHQNGDNEEVDVPEELEIEALFLPKIKAFGIQGHPEWMVDDLTTCSIYLDKFLEMTKEKFSALATPELTFEILETSDVYRNVTKDIFLDAMFTKALSYTKSYLLFLGGLDALTDYKFEIGSFNIRTQLLNILNNVDKILELSELLKSPNQFSSYENNHCKMLLLNLKNNQLEKYFMKTSYKDLDLKDLIMMFGLKLEPKQSKLANPLYSNNEISKGTATSVKGTYAYYNDVPEMPNYGNDPWKAAPMAQQAEVAIGEVINGAIFGNEDEGEEVENG